MMKVVLGSKNAAKLAATEMAVASYWPDAIVLGEDVGSGVPDQPIGHEQTWAGALNRARAALALHDDATLGIGLEGGIAEIAGRDVMVGYVAVVGRDGQQSVACTASTPLPAPWAKALRDGAELRPLVLEAGLPYDYKTGVVGLLTDNKVSRDESFALAIRGAMAPWVCPEAYAGGAEAA